MLFHKKAKAKPNDRRMNPQFYLGYDRPLNCHSMNVAWCEMAIDYLPFLEMRLQALKGTMSSGLYAALNRDMDRLAQALLHCRETWHPHSVTQLLFHRLRIAVVMAEKPKAEF